MDDQIEAEGQPAPHLPEPRRVTPPAQTAAFASRAAAGRRPAFVFVLPWEPHHIGGVSAVVNNLARVVAERGTMRSAVVADVWAASSPRYAADSMSFRFSLLGSTSPLGLLKALVMAPASLRRTRTLLAGLDAQVVNFHYPGLAPLGVAILKRLGLFRGKLVLSFHGTDVAPPRGSIERLLQAFVLRSADRLVACSRGLAQRMETELAIPAQRIDVVYNGVNEAVFDAAGKSEARLPAQLPDTFIVNIGSFIARKNHQLLLRAFAQLAPANPRLHLCIAGADGSERPALERAVQELGLADRVHLFVDLSEQQVAELLARATVCVQPSLAESFPLALLEAGSTGTPLVVSDIPGHDEIVRREETGLSFPSGDVAACAREIARMLHEPGLAARLAAAQRRQVRGHFTWSASVLHYERLLA